MSVVVDASMAIAWLLPDEQTEATTLVLRQLLSDQGLIPTIFRHEVRNILLVSERRKRVTPAEVDEILGAFERLALEDRGHGDDRDVMALDHDAFRSNPI